MPVHIDQSKTEQKQVYSTIKSYEVENNVRMKIIAIPTRHSKMCICKYLRRCIQLPIF